MMETDSVELWWHNQGTPGMAGSHQKPGERREHFLLLARQEGTHRFCSGFGLRACRTVEEYIAIALSHHVCTNLWWQPRETNTRPGAAPSALISLVKAGHLANHRLQGQKDQIGPLGGLGKGVGQSERWESGDDYLIYHTLRFRELCILKHL